MKKLVITTLAAAIAAASIAPVASAKDFGFVDKPHVKLPAPAAPKSKFPLKPAAPKPSKPDHNHGAAAAIGIGAFLLGAAIASQNNRECWYEKRYDKYDNPYKVKVCEQ